MEHRLGIPGDRAVLVRRVALPLQAYAKSAGRGLAAGNPDRRNAQRPALYPAFGGAVQRAEAGIGVYQQRQCLVGIDAIGGQAAIGHGSGRLRLAHGISGSGCRTGRIDLAAFVSLGEHASLTDLRHRCFCGRQPDRCAFA
ncbi:hypothetical protein D9M71_533630 [compost metagenome]